MPFNNNFDPALCHVDHFAAETVAKKICHRLCYDFQLFLPKSWKSSTCPTPSPLNAFAKQKHRQTLVSGVAW